MVDRPVECKTMSDRKIRLFARSNFYEMLTARVAVHLHSQFIADCVDIVVSPCNIADTTKTPLLIELKQSNRRRCRKNNDNSKDIFHYCCFITS